ncbi:hypothetical protein DB32_007939 [Sandaracinus amylolyticus]|uniref:Uncharacterized protein n=1 Tax=Sandaracinus amylolyticus TaxID=927083 RepID=A0A0F6W9H9_9BACT|nr:hypothetical protein DB32_007939 [Sandaracinus amylolyticus]
MIGGSRPDRALRARNSCAPRGLCSANSSMNSRAVPGAGLAESRPARADRTLR